MGTHQVGEKSKPIKIKDKILKQYKARADDWAETVMVPVAGSSNDLHASDDNYHRDCLTRSFSQRNAPGESKGTHDEEHEVTLQLTGLTAHHRYASLSYDVIVILSAPRYRKVVIFRDNAHAPFKVMIVK